MQSTPPLPFDAAALVAWLTPRLPGDWSRLSITQFVGGQSNPTYRLDAGTARYVLRKKPPGQLLPSAHAVDREFRVLAALAGSAVPVPRAHLYCDDATLIGTPFYVMDCVDGRVLKEPRLPGMTSAERTALYDAMNATIAALHSLDPAAIGLADFGRHGNYYARQVTRWTEQYRRSQTDPINAMERLIEWLPRNLPARETVALVHGDFRIENLVIDARVPRILAVLDWELSTLGDPLGDLAYNCLWFRLPPLAFGGLADVPLHDAGIPDERAYLDAYCRRTGRDGIANWSFYVAFAFFRLAAILQGVMRRALDGNASSPDAIARGRLAGLCAELGCAAIDESR